MATTNINAHVSKDFKISQLTHAHSQDLINVWSDGFFDSARGNHNIG